MAYIGRIPQVGNYFTLDAITTSATDTFNLLKGGVAYVPESAYHIFVSLNGVIQAPITAYTVSGSTIIFDSALASTDVIDFITVLGDTLAIGTPSDATVTDAKIVDMAATKLTGSIADARVPASAVTQHVTGYDDSAIRADISALALREATNETSAAFNLPNSFIDTFTDDTNLGTQTTVDRTSGYISSIYASAGNDSYTKLLLHGDESPLVDSSGVGHTLGLVGSIARSSTQSKFGSYSISFNGSSQRITLPDTNDWDLGTADWTIDWWAYKTSTDKESIFESRETGDGFNVETTPSNYLHYYDSGNTAGTGASPVVGDPTVHTQNTWIHYAIERKDTTIRLYRNGTIVDTQTGASGDMASESRLYIGSNDTPANWFSGYLDEFRWSKGIARYNATNFTPETTAYGSTVVNATGTLIQSANAVASAKTEVSGTILYKDNAGTATLGTDLKIYFTCNGGSNWTEAASYNAITPVYATGIKQVRLGKTTCTSGTDIRYKAVWANQAASSKETQLHGISVNY